jgi:hypothetical protein
MEHSKDVHAPTAAPNRTCMISPKASPTVSTDTLLLSIIKDAYEARDFGTADVVGAYLKAFMDNFVIMKFVGPSVRMLCKLNPNTSAS